MRVRRSSGSGIARTWEGSAALLCILDRLFQPLMNHSKAMIHSCLAFIEFLPEHNMSISFPRGPSASSKFQLALQWLVGVRAAEYYPFPSLSQHSQFLHEAARVVTQSPTQVSRLRNKLYQDPSILPTFSVHRGRLTHLLPCIQHRPKRQPTIVTYRR